MYNKLLFQLINLHRDAIFSNKNANTQYGFTIMEALVSILALSIFFLGALQTVVLASLLRVQAADKQETIDWVQQDLELIRYEAFILDSGAPDATTCTSSTYGTRLRDDVLLNDNYSPTGEDFSDDPTTITIENDQMTTDDDKNYTITRTYTPSDNILQITYSISYASTHPRYKGGTAADNEITTLSTEVLPNEALNCT